MSDKLGRKSSTKKAADLRACAEQISADKIAGKRRAMSFLLKVLVAVTLPASDPGTDSHTRTNGRYSMTISSETSNRLPWGIYPRLIMIWICTQAIKTGKKDLFLGKNFGVFLSAICNVGKNAKPSSYQRRHVMDQLKRLIATTFSITEINNRRESVRSICIADKSNLWTDKWDSGKQQMSKRERGCIILTQEFFEYIKESSVPFDASTIKAFGSSPFQLDVFLWASWRAPRIDAGSEPKMIPYEGLKEQFGTNQKRLYDFKKEFLAALENVRLTWPELTYEDKGKGIVLQHAQSLVPRHLASKKVDDYEPDCGIFDDDDDVPF